MKRTVILAVFPLIGLALLLTAFLWSWRDVNLRLRGQSVEGRIVGMALQRQDKSDLLTGLDTALTLGLADGGKIEALYRDYTLVSAIDENNRQLTPTELDAATALQSSPLSPDLRRVLADALHGKAEIIRWALLREGRRLEDPRRVLRIEKTETIHAFLDLKEVPVVMDLRDGKIHLPDSPTPGTVTIRAVFDSSDAGAIAKRKGDTLEEYEYLREGVSFTPDKKDFFLFAEPYQTQFLPVFGFVGNGQAIARLSHIGRHGGPTLALRLYEDCLVYYDRKNPEEAILMATPGPINGDWLAWFSRLCEGFFAQWGSGSLIALAGLTFIATGAVFISLAIWPGKIELAES